MNFYLRVQRLSDGYAARVFEELFPEPRTRRNIALFLRSFVERAAAGTTAWSVTLDHDSIRLNVGPVQLLALASDQVLFCALPSERERWPSWVHNVSQGPMVYPKSVPVRSFEYSVRPSRVGALPSLLAELALQYVDQAASRRKGSSAWLKSNSPGVLGFLEAYLDCTLPRPLGDSAGETGFIFMPIEVEEGRTYLEGTTVRVTVNAFERSRAARSACLELHGKRCSVCGLLLAERYGEIAADLIHVHHLRPLRDIGTSYRVDPFKDLCPVCPNCHAVIHLREPPLLLEEARMLLKRSGSPANTGLNRTDTALSRGPAG
jgi:hypothetical protein